MSLNYSFGNVKHYQSNFDSLYVKYSQFGSEYEDLNPEAKSIVFATMSVGIGTITNANASEFYGRMKFLEKVDDLYLYSYVDESTNTIEYQYVTTEIINKYIGLSTNVTFESTTFWLDTRYKRDKKFESCMSKADAKVYIKYHAIEYKERFSEKNV